VQLSFDGAVFGHSLLVVLGGGNIRIASHTDDSFDRPLGSYFYAACRLLHIEGVR
jgi:hypothetical protein